MEKENNITTGMVQNQPSADGALSSDGAIAEPGAVGQTEDVSSFVQKTNATNKEDNSVLRSDGNEETTDVKADSKSLKRAEFEKLIKGDYKEFYEERIKDNLSRRFKENSALKQLNDRNSRIVDMLYDKYNVERGNYAHLVNAIEADDAYLAEEAGKRGMSTEDYKYIRRLETENRRYHEMSAKYEAMDKANRTVEKWYRESEQVRDIYPEFNIFEESKNKSFVSLVKSGIDVKTAYEAVHHNEIVSRAVEDAARTAEIKAAETIKQRAMRPAENGLSSQSSAILKNDVSKLSPRERAEIAQRVARGERITF